MSSDELPAVFLDGQFGRPVAAQPAGGRRQALQLAAAGVRALIQAAQAGFRQQGVGKTRLPALNAAGQKLGHQGVAIAVHDQPRQAVGFAMNQPNTVALDVKSGSGPDGTLRSLL
jgi:hypothetical protein